MPKYFCDYCQIYLTHDTSKVRRDHNSGWKHALQVKNYYTNQVSQQTLQWALEHICKEYTSRGIPIPPPPGVSVSLASVSGPPPMPMPMSMPPMPHPSMPFAMPFPGAPMHAPFMFAPPPPHFNAGALMSAFSRGAGGPPAMPFAYPMAPPMPPPPASSGGFAPFPHPPPPPASSQGNSVK